MFAAMTYPFTPLSPGENLALTKPATQSDVLWSYSPQLAVDGDPNTCSFTSRREGQRWWQVLILSPY